MFLRTDYYMGLGSNMYAAFNMPVLVVPEMALSSQTFVKLSEFYWMDYPI